MGVNGQKRKKKQGPVPSLEETLPKKFKSEKHSKPKKVENGVQKTRKPVSANGVKTKAAQKVGKALTVEHSRVEEESEGESENEVPDFSVTKASLFDDIEEEEDGDEFGGLEEDM